ncbi:MAG: HupE/UreJ family protein [Terriglobia bacterium]
MTLRPALFSNLTSSRKKFVILWLCVLTQWFNLSPWAHMTGVSYSEIEISKTEIKIWLQLNLRELQMARQLDRNGDLLITEEEIKASSSLLEPPLLEQIQIVSNGESGRGRLDELNFNPPRGELRCHLIYSFVKPLEDEVLFRVRLHSLTDSGHWNLARLKYDGLEEQRSFNLETPEGKIELRRGPGSYLKLAWRYFVYAVREFVSTPEVLPFLLAIILIESTWRGSRAILIMMFLGQAIGFAYDTWQGPSFSVRFVHSAIAMSVAYMAAENLFIQGVRYRAIISGVLSLIFGLNFSDFVRSIGYPRKGMALSVLSFQLGLALSVTLWGVAMFAILKWLRPWTYYRRLFLILSFLLAGFGLYRFLQVTF